MTKQSDGMDEKSIALQLIHTARLQRTRAAELLNDIGLFPGQDQVLQSLARKESGGSSDDEIDGIAMGDLAAELRVRAPTVSKTIARLSTQGLVERKGAGLDKRQVYVKLTEEGRRRASQIDAITRQMESELVDGLDSKDRKRFRKLLRKAAKNLANATGEHLGADVGDDTEE